tara:strand:+ start:8824 stop:9225 length:402 start_codon:yes stop_codon:yes gene_type:complete
MRESLKTELRKLGGKNLTIKENPESKIKKHKKVFTEIVLDLKNLHMRSEILDIKYGIHLVHFEDEHYKIIEQLLIETYGIAAAEVIFWWVYNFNSDSKPEDYYIEEENTGKKYYVKTENQLYTLLKKLKLFKQ